MTLYLGVHCDGTVVRLSNLREWENRWVFFPYFSTNSPSNKNSFEKNLITYYLIKSDKCENRVLHSKFSCIIDYIFYYTTKSEKMLKIIEKVFISCNFWESLTELWREGNSYMPITPFDDQNPRMDLTDLHWGSSILQVDQVFIDKFLATVLPILDYACSHNNNRWSHFLTSKLKCDIVNILYINNTMYFGLWRNILYSPWPLFLFWWFLGHPSRSGDLMILLSCSSIIVHPL